MQKRRLRRSVGFGSGETSPAHCLARGTATLCLSLALTLQLNLASAQQKSWSGNSNTDGNWSRRQNWTSASSSPLNNGTAILTFGASTRTNSAVDTAWSVSSMTFASGASAFRFSGSTLTFNGGLTNNSSAAQTFNNQVALSSAQTWNNNAGTMSFAGGITNRGFTLGVTGGGNSSVSGVFSGAGGLNKSGTGTLTLSGANTFSGNTAINGGRLLVNNSVGSGTGSGNVAVNSGGALGGTGIIAGMVTMNAGATIGAGVNVGLLSTGSETWNSGGIFAVQMKNATGTAGSGWDRININGALTLNASASSRITLSLSSLTAADVAGNAQNFDALQAYAWTILTTTDGIQMPVNQTEDTVFDFVMSGFSNPSNGGQFSVDVANSGKDLKLVYTPVPEPTAANVLLMGLGILMLVQARDRFTTDRRS